MIGLYAQKLLAYLGIYRITPTEYNNRLATHPHVRKSGLFADALQELVDYETAYGYFPV